MNCIEWKWIRNIWAFVWFVCTNWIEKLFGWWIDETIESVEWENILPIFYYDIDVICNTNTFSEHKSIFTIGSIASIYVTIFFSIGHRNFANESSLNLVFFEFIVHKEYWIPIKQSVLHSGDNP